MGAKQVRHVLSRGSLLTTGVRLNGLIAVEQVHITRDVIFVP